MKLTVAGGLYVEWCSHPLWNSVFGSGGRAAAAVSAIVPETTLVTYVPKTLIGDAEALAGLFGFNLRAETASYPVEFDYLHPLATPRITPPLDCMATQPSLLVECELALRFGMLEGTAIVHADVAVYDPQSAFGAEPFSRNGSTAKRLAVVLNRGEAVSMTHTHLPEDAANWLMREEGAEVVVIKMGAKGAYVATKNRAEVIPLYRSEHVWKIGSGDVFSSAFAAFWGAHGIEPFVAADLASRATAMYCNARILPILEKTSLEQADLMPVIAGRGTIYLAGPFFDIGQRWLVEETRSLLTDLGAKVFSPVHEVGPGPGKIVAPEDIKGLEASDIVFAILNGLDTGTAFEAGYAVKKGIPVVVLAQNVRDEDLKMLIGTKCEVVDDFASAIYRALWKLPKG